MRTGGTSLLSSPQWLYKLRFPQRIYCMISSPYPRKNHVKLQGIFLPAEDWQLHSLFEILLWQDFLSVLVEIIVFSPYFRIRIPLFSISWDQALDLLVSVSYTHYCAYTSDLSTLLSARGLTTLRYGISYLEVSFTLRCFQRLSHPHFATLPCRWRDNRCTIGAFIPVLSY